MAASLVLYYLGVDKISVDVISYKFSDLRNIAVQLNK